MKKLFLLSLICLSLAAGIKAQTESSESSRKIEAAVKNLPLSGSKPEDFIPAGWEVHGEIAHGDLNGDRLTDYAFDITPNNSRDGDDFFYDAVLVLYGEPGGKLRRGGFNDKLSDNGFGAKQLISIEKGILIANNNYGNNSATDVTFKFRFDKAVGKLLLIGFDYETYTRSGNEDGSVTSYNFPAGIKEEIINYIDRRPNPQGIYDKQSKKRERIKRVKIPFENAQLRWDEAKNENLPY